MIGDRNKSQSYEVVDSVGAPETIENQQNAEKLNKVWNSAVVF